MERCAGTVLDYNQAFRSFHNKAEVAKACGYHVRLDGNLRRLDKRGELQPLVIVRPAPPPCPARDPCYDEEEQILGGSPASPLSSAGAGEEEAMFFLEVDEGRPRVVAMELAAESLDNSVVRRLQDRVVDAKLETAVRRARRGLGGLYGRGMQGQEAGRLQVRAGDAVQETGVGITRKGLCGLHGRGMQGQEGGIVQRRAVDAGLEPGVGRTGRGLGGLLRRGMQGRTVDRVQRRVVDAGLEPGVRGTGRGLGVLHGRGMQERAVGSSCRSLGQAEGSQGGAEGRGDGATGQDAAEVGVVQSLAQTESCQHVLDIFDGSWSGRMDIPASSSQISHQGLGARLCRAGRAFCRGLLW